MVWYVSLSWCLVCRPDVPLEEVVELEMSKHGRNTEHNSSKLETDERKHGDHEWESEDVY
jgi:hypothetical protein